jgi:hypothetical protein
MLRALVELAVGVALLALAAAARLRPRDTAPASTVGRGHRLVERLRSLRPATALAAGVLLGVGGPKRLVLTLLAAGSIAAVDGGRSQQAWLVVAYTLVATLPAWAPIVVFELVGDRVTVALGALQRWLLRHRRELLTYLLVPLGLLMVADAVASLV